MHPATASTRSSWRSSPGTTEGAEAEAAVTEATRAVEASHGAQLADACEAVEAEHRKRACAPG
jgi:hypothetical protein